MRNLTLVQRPLAPLGPRARRAKYLTNALSSDWEVTRWPNPSASIRITGSSSRLTHIGRSILRHTTGAVLLDRLEPATRRSLRQLPHTDAALLVGPPFSPVVLAATEFAKRGTPYVLDLGDPWALTAEHSAFVSLTMRRQRRAEHVAFAAAAGAILTTPGQATAIAACFPRLPILIRPNGYEPVKMRTTVTTPPSGDTLRLVYYGGFYETYSVPALRSLCATLVATGPWREISLTIFGRDWTGALATLPAPISVAHREPVAWPTVVAEADGFDAALVVGHTDPRKLPSKAVQYLTLPIPRIAACADELDSLGVYVADKPGYLVVTPGITNAERLVSHLRRPWSSAELAPPPSESWDEVAPTISQFVKKAISPS